MGTISGVVEAVNSKEVPGKFGKPFTVRSMLINGDWYNAGFKKEHFADKGTAVSVTFNEGKYGKDVVSLTTGAASVTADGSTSSVARTSTYASRPFPVPVTHGDRAIIRQNALTNAREFMGAFSNSTGQLTALEDMKTLAHDIIEIAYIFEDYTSGDREKNKVEAAMAKIGAVGK